MDEKTEKDILQDIAGKEYEHGFVTDVEQEFIPKGLNEDIIRLISSKKEEPEWLLEFRLDAFRRWQKMKMPTWAHLDIPEIDFQDIIYYAAPKKDSDRPWAYLSMNGRRWPVWLSMLCLIRYQLLRLSVSLWPTKV